MKLIDKDALIAEIERRLKKYAALDVGNSEELEAIYGAECKALIDILKFLDTLEVKEVPIWEKVSPDTGQTTLYKDGGKSYLERFGYRIDLKDLDKLPKKNLKAQKGENYESTN